MDVQIFAAIQTLGSWAAVPQNGRTEDPRPGSAVDWDTLRDSFWYNVVEPVCLLTGAVVWMVAFVLAVVWVVSRWIPMEGKNEGSRKTGGTNPSVAVAGDAMANGRSGPCI